MLSALLLGCAAMTCGKPPETADRPEDVDGSEVEQPVEAAQMGTSGTDDGPDAEVLPAYSPEALAARFDAQRALLGQESLFEDAEGRPLAPPIEASEGVTGGGAGSIDDDILAALPGSSGIRLDESGEIVTGELAHNGNALGLFVPIEQPRGEAALAEFHAALAALAEGKDDDGKVRVLVYGASHTQADVYPSYLRAYLQARFGDGGSGFLALTRCNGWYRYTDWSIDETKGWKVEHAQRREARKDGYFGLLGASGSTSNKRDKTLLMPRSGVVAGNYELYFLAQPGGGSFRLHVDGSKLATVDTDAKQIGPGYHAFTIDEGEHTIEVRAVGDGEVRLFGITAEREQPGVVVDTLGIAGTRAANMLSWDEALLADNLAHRKPDLIVLAYGTNEATDEDQSMHRYRADLREVVTRLQRAAPQASCLLVGPGDFPREVDEDVWAVRPRVLEIVEAQRDVAYELGCGFWDMFAFMGGSNSMHTWATSRPQMASRDHIHLTQRGYVRMGMVLTDALMSGYDRLHGVP
ncbi:SGNH/GDSL hydrolase family protein [Nannocystaceae bacterium ST9]